ncbi:MAG: hypothetical protein IKS54_10865 [Erysipelotrichaceae bacterium]|nr:hypothetical protein [Erysipelotrichaceae bacterium]
MRDFITTVFPIVFLLLLGVFFKKKKILNSEQIEGLKYISMNVFLPVVLFRTFLNSEYDLSILNYLFVIYPVCLAMLGIGYLIRKRMNGDQSVPFMMTGFEVGMLGYALYGFLNKGNDLAALAMIDFGHSIFMFSTYFVLLNMSYGKGTIKDSLLSTFRSPFFIAFISGLLLGASGIGSLMKDTVIMGCIDSLFDIFGKALSATILISLGYGIEISRDVLKQSLILTISRAVLALVFGTIAVKGFDMLIGLDQKLLSAALIFFVLPPTFTVAAYIKDEENMKLVSTMSSIYTILTILSFFVIVLSFQ